MKSIAIFTAFFSFSAFAYDAICISNNPNLRSRVSYTEVRGYTESVELFDEIQSGDLIIPQGDYKPFKDVEGKLLAAGSNLYCDEGAYVRGKFDANNQLVLSVTCHNDSAPSMTLMTLKLDCM